MTRFIGIDPGIKNFAFVVIDSCADGKSPVLMDSQCYVLTGKTAMESAVDVMDDLYGTWIISDDSDVTVVVESQLMYNAAIQGVIVGYLGARGALPVVMGAAKKYRVMYDDPEFSRLRYEAGKRPCNTLKKTAKKTATKDWLRYMLETEKLRRTSPLSIHEFMGRFHKMDDIADSVLLALTYMNGLYQ